MLDEDGKVKEPQWEQPKQIKECKEVTTPKITVNLGLCENLKKEVENRGHLSYHEQFMGFVKK